MIFFAKKLITALHSFINFKMGTISGLFTGSIVFFINLNHGLYPALGSFGKQFVFNLLMAGYNAKSCERLAKNIKPTKFALFVATVIPTLQAFIILFSVHYFGKTPKPLGSTLWQAFANLGIFFFMALIYRKDNNHRLINIMNGWKLEKELIGRKINNLTKKAS